MRVSKTLYRTHIAPEVDKRIRKKTTFLLQEVVFFQIIQHGLYQSYLQIGFIERFVRTSAFTALSGDFCRTKIRKIKIRRFVFCLRQGI